MNFRISLTAFRFTIAGLLLSCAGCRRATTFSIFCSIFPGWLFCFAAGVLLSFAVYLLLLRFELNEQLAPPLLVYPALAACFSVSLWLILFD